MKRFLVIKKSDTYLYGVYHCRSSSLSIYKKIHVLQASECKTLQTKISNKLQNFSPSGVFFLKFY